MVAKDFQGSQSVTDQKIAGCHIMSWQGHYITNPNNALLWRESQKLPYISLVWSSPTWCVKKKLVLKPFFARMTFQLGRIPKKSDFHTTKVTARVFQIQKTPAQILLPNQPKGSQKLTFFWKSPIKASKTKKKSWRFIDYYNGLEMSPTKNKIWTSKKYVESLNVVNPSNNTLWSPERWMTCFCVLKWSFRGATLGV